MTATCESIKIGHVSAVFGAGGFLAVLERRLHSTLTSLDRFHNDFILATLYVSKSWEVSFCNVRNFSNHAF